MSCRWLTAGVAAVIAQAPCPSGNVFDLCQLCDHEYVYWCRSDLCRRSSHHLGVPVIRSGLTSCILLACSRGRGCGYPTRRAALATAQRPPLRAPRHARSTTPRRSPPMVGTCQLGAQSSPAVAVQMHCVFTICDGLLPTVCTLVGWRQRGRVSCCLHAHAGGVRCEAALLRANPLTLGEQLPLYRHIDAGAAAWYKHWCELRGVRKRLPLHEADWDKIVQARAASRRKRSCSMRRPGRRAWAGPAYAPSSVSASSKQSTT